MQLREMAAEDLCTCVLGRTRKSLLEPGLLLLASPQIIADTLDNPDDQARAAKYIDERASRGLRSIAVAQAPGGGGGASGSWRLVGLISLLDPPRPDSAATILRAQELGVEVRLPLALAGPHPIHHRSCCCKNARSVAEVRQPLGGGGAHAALSSVKCSLLAGGLGSALL